MAQNHSINTLPLPRGLYRVLMIFSSVSLLIVSACSPNPMASPTPQVENTATQLFSTVTATETVLPTFTPSPSPTATLAPQADQTAYTLTAVLDYQTHILSVEESIRYTNRSTDRLENLVIVVEPAFQNGLFTLIDARWQDGTTIENIIQETGFLSIPLPNGLAEGQEIDLSFTYTIDLPPSLGTLCFTDRQINLTGWYPYLPPYITGQGWLTHSPSSVGEYQVYELANFDVQFRIDNAPATLQIAASAQAVSNGTWYEYHQTDSRTFSLSISPYYQVIEGLAGTTTIQEYYFAEDEAAAQTVLSVTTQAVDLYGRLFGMNNRDYLAIVEGTFPDGMEYDGLYFLGEEYYQSFTGGMGSYLVTIAVHETAHEWWFAAAANDQALEPWLDETLCTYTELLFYENYYPEEVEWWWPNRIEYYGAQGYVNSTIYDYLTFRPYVNAVYLNGAVFLHGLRTDIGDAAFFAFVQDYFTTLHYAANLDHTGLSTTELFFEILSRNTSFDFSNLRSMYFTGE